MADREKGSAVEGDSFISMLRDFFNIGRGKADYAVIRGRIQDGARIDGIHVLQLIAAILIASIGLNLNSTEAVIGAMLICPIMESVLAIALAIAQVDMAWLKNALWGLAIQVTVCLMTSTLYFVLSPISSETSVLLTNSQPTVWDVVIALVGGFAGGLGNSRRDMPSTLIAGVAVATALMPPLCSVGYGVAQREVATALAAFYEFAVNVVFIAFGAELVFVALKMPLAADLNGDGVVSPEEEAIAKASSERLRRRLVVGSLIFAIPCLSFSARVVRQSIDSNGTVFEVLDTYETEVTTLELEAVCPELVGYRIGEEDSFVDGRIVQRLVATVVTDEELSEERQRQLRKLIEINTGPLDDVGFEVADDAGPDEAGSPDGAEGVRQEGPDGAQVARDATASLNEVATDVPDTTDAATGDDGGAGPTP